MVRAVHNETRRIIQVQVCNTLHLVSWWMRIARWSRLQGVLEVEDGRWLCCWMVSPVFVGAPPPSYSWQKMSYTHHAIHILSLPAFAGVMLTFLEVSESSGDSHILCMRETRSKSLHAHAFVFLVRFPLRPTKNSWRLCTRPIGDLSGSPQNITKLWWFRGYLSPQLPSLTTIVVSSLLAYVCHCCPHHPIVNVQFPWPLLGRTLSLWFSECAVLLIVQLRWIYSFSESVNELEVSEGERSSSPMAWA